MKFHVLIFQILLSRILNAIIFSFQRKIKTLSNFNEYLMQNDLITEIKIGTPQQKISVLIKGDEHPFYISQLNRTYNENTSTTYKKISEGETVIYTESFKNYYLSTETFQMENTNNTNLTIKNFTFIYAINSYNYTFLYPAIIGLYHKDYTHLKGYNLIYLLKQYEIVNNHAFSIEYKDENKGKLYLGDYFHNFNNSYQESNFLQIYTSFQGVGYVWGSHFNNVYYNNISLEDPLYNFYFNLTLPGIVVTNTFKNILEKNLFNNSLCEKINIDNYKYYAYVCDKKFEYKQFKELKFYHKETNYTFILNYNDLFKEENGKIYCLLLFKTYSSITWFLGEPFLKKYTFSFNQENKLMGFYKNIIVNNNYSYTWVLITILILIYLFLTFLLVKNVINKPRKLRANELEDNYDYISKIN